jgi:hypothetical protein
MGHPQVLLNEMNYELAKGFFQRDRETGSEELGRTVVGDDHVVFAAQAEFSGNVDAGLVREGHAGLEEGFAATD